MSPSRANAAKLVGWLGLALMWPVAVARADDGHYQNFLPGGRAAGMGGAFTAIADDPSATYFNPAGLVDAVSDQISANLNFYGFQQQSLQNAIHAAGLQDSVGAALNQLNTVPGLAGSLNGLGPRDLTGHHRQVWAFTVIVPDDTSLSQTSFAVDSQGHLQSLAQTNIDQTALAALGYGLRLDPQWSIGASVSALYRRISRRSRSVGASNATNGGPTAVFFEDDLSLDLSVVGIYGQAGVMWKPLPTLTLGLTLAGPSWTVFSSGLADEVQATAGTLTETYQSGLTGDSRWPWHGRVGASYRIDRQWLVAVDLSLWGITHYALVNQAAVVGSTATRLPNFVNNIDRRLTGNLNAGVEYRLFERYPLRAGIFTNSSSAPTVDTGTAPQLDDINLLGFTLGFTLPGGHTDSTFGLSYSFGNGQAKTPTANAAAGALSYVAGPASRIFLDLFAGGATQF